MFLIQIRYTAPLDTIEQYRAAHRAFLETACQNNQVIFAGPLANGTGGIILSPLSDQQTVETFFQEDPYLKAAVADYAFVEFTPVKWHKDFSPFIH